jgi:hypothetical protein
MKNFLGLCIAILGIQGAAYAEQFDYKPGMAVELGASWNPLSPGDKAGSGNCVTATASTASTAGYNASEEYTEKFVETFEELQRVTSMSLSAAGTYGFGFAKVSAAASYDSLRETFKNNRSIVYVVSGRRTYTPVAIGDIALTPSGTGWLKEAQSKSDPKAFYSKCGEAIITSITKETKVSLVYIFTASNAMLREKIRSAISLAASGGGNSGTASVKMYDEARKADANIALDLKVFQAGALDSSESIRNTVGENPGDINAVRASIKKVIADISWKSSAIASFNAVKLSEYFDIPAQPTWTYALTAYSRLDGLRDTSEKLVRRYLQLKDVLTDADNFSIVLKPDARPRIIAELEAIDSALENLVATARDCFANKQDTCKSKYYDGSTKVMLYIDPDYGTFSRWNGNSEGAYDYNIEHVVFSAKFWPEFTLRNTRYIREIDVLRDGQVAHHIDAQKINTLIANGVFSLESVMPLAYTNKMYCSKTDKNRREVCVPLGANSKHHLNNLKAQSSATYSLRITDLEGNRSALSTIPLAQAVFD